MAILLTESYQQIAYATKSFTAGASQTCKLIIYAKYQNIDEAAGTAQVVVQTKVKSNKSGYSWSSSDNTSTVTLDGVKKTRKFDIGKVTTTEKTISTMTYDVTYAEDGTWENKTLNSKCDVYGSVTPSATGYVTLPPIQTGVIHVNIGGTWQVGKVYVYNGGWQRAQAHVFSNGTWEKGK